MSAVSPISAQLSSLTKNRNGMNLKLRYALRAGGVIRCSYTHTTIYERYLGKKDRWLHIGWWKMHREEIGKLRERLRALAWPKNKGCVLITQPKTQQSWCKLWILSVRCKFAIMFHQVKPVAFVKSVKIDLDATSIWTINRHKACWQLAAHGPTT